jgi:hypothetical protein
MICSECLFASVFGIPYIGRSIRRKELSVSLFPIKHTILKVNFKKFVQITWRQRLVWLVVGQLISPVLGQLNNRDSLV